MSKIALCLIVKGSDGEAENLKTCLSNLSPHVDGIFVTITQPNERVKEVAELFGAIVSHFEWCNDFAAARNFNFSQVPKEFDYILWCDADDVFRGIENLKTTMEANPSDCYAFHYMYAFDEWKNPTVVHAKTQVVKNDGTFKWAGRLHEDFSPTREVKPPYFIKGIERIHLSNDERYNAAKERNLVIAEEQAKDEPEDPRSFWNLGNALIALDRFNDALSAFDTFLEQSKSDDESYIVRLRRAEAFYGLGDSHKAIDEARYAIGTKPDFPDAYFTLGSLYISTNQLEKAAETYILGLGKQPPYFNIIVYNPRNYDYVPLMALAKVYFGLERPEMALICLQKCLEIYPKDENLKKLVNEMSERAEEAEKVYEIAGRIKNLKSKDKIKAELDKVPEELKYHPLICNIRNTNFIKTESTGKEVSIFCGYTAEEWTPDTVKEKGIGGSEEAVIWLSNLLAEKGWDVTVFNNCGHLGGNFGAVTYKPFMAWNYRDKTDVTILWRTPKYCDYEINSPKVFIDLHDVIPAGEFTEERLKRITKVLVKSEFHRELFPNIKDDKIQVIPNGIDPEVFGQEIERDSNLIINTSSPNRALSSLIEIMREVRKQVPEARMKWAYGWGTTDAGFQGDLKVAEWKKNLIAGMEEVGIEELGRVNHEDVAKLYMQASIYAYPTGFGEIFCISAIKAQAAGCIPLTTNFSALKETNKFGKRVESKLTKETWAQPYQYDFADNSEEVKQLFVEEIVRLLKSPPSEVEREEMRRWAKKNYSWAAVTNQWESLFNG